MNLQVKKEEIDERVEKLKGVRNKFVYYGTIDEGSFEVGDRLEIRNLILNFLDKRINEEKDEKVQIEVDLGIFRDDEEQLKGGTQNG